MEADKVVKALRLCANKWENCGGCHINREDCPFGKYTLGCIERMNRAAADLIETPMEAARWIPVSERLPMEAECVLAWGIYGFAKCAMVGCLQEGRWLLEGPFDDATVTHWMPLPAAPKEEE